ncbi:hypothetical protein LCGC14_2237430 [marine sediment metagenome]|uniref:Uncharacterized protein n=1 Tax=marine sediment metagenome TaxID=412755 RepID=A0A0F9FIY1_9ZZZZ
MEPVNALLAGFSDEVLKLAADLTPSQPAADQNSFAGVQNRLHSRTGVRKLLPSAIGNMVTRAGAPPPRTTPITPPQMRQDRGMT